MATHLDANSAECVVLTFKEGLLSPIAHDLKLRFARIDVELQTEPLGIQAHFATASLQVVCARESGRDAPSRLSEADKRKIEANIRNEVLHTGLHPEAHFVSTAVEENEDGYRVKGELTLHGKTRPLALTARHRNGKLSTEVTLHQPDFGIKPYRAALGTLRVQADVQVHVTLPAPV